MRVLSNIIWSVFIALALTGCNEIPEGYLSETIVYTRNPFSVSAGKTTYSEAPNLAGSSYPIKFELLEVRNEKGDIDTSLYKLRDLYIWSAPYNSLTDRTIEDVQKKRTLVPNQPTMQLIEGSGQLLFTEATSAVLPGKYSLTLKMSNSAGSRILKNIVTINLQNAPYTYENQNHNIAATGSGWIEPGGANPSDVKGIGILGAVSKVTHNPAGPNKMHLIIKDKNGIAWSWKKGEIVKRGDRPCLEYALPFVQGEFGDTDLTYAYPFAPFPFGATATPDGGQWTRRFDYRVLDKGVSIQGLTPGKWHCNLVFYFSFNFAGEWTFELTFPNLTRLSS